VEEAHILIPFVLPDGSRFYSVVVILKPNQRRLLPSEETASRVPSASRSGRVFGNIAWLFADKILRMGVGVGVSLAIARFLGPEQYGSLNYLSALVGLFGAAAPLGLDQIVVRDLVHRPDDEPEFTGTALGLRLCSSVLCSAMCLALLYWMGALGHGNYNGLFFALMLPFDSSAVFEFLFQAKVQSKYTVIARNSAFAVVAVVRLSFLYFHMPLVFFAAAYLMESSLGALLMLISYARRSGHSLHLSFSLTRARQMLKESWPVILSASAIVIYVRIDVVMLQSMAGSAAVGIYAAATRVSEVWYFVPMGIMTTVSPLITSYHANERLYYGRLQQFFSGMAAFSVAVSIIVTLAYSFIMRHLFGVGFAASGPILAVHVWSSIFVFLGVAQGPWMVTEKKMKISMFQTALGAVSNVLINLILIPRLQGMGAAIATVISYAISAVFANLLFRDTRRIFHMQMNAFRFVGLPGFLSMTYASIRGPSNA
jgi:polysaccharide transporter, PST family